MDAALRELVVQRAASRCEYCRVEEAFDALPFQVDHIIARQHNGPTEADNLALACNHHKGPNIASVDWSTGEAEIVRLFHPGDDDWDEHFEWNRTLLVGKTPIGRATVLCLAVNLPHRVAFRDALADE